jgi:hypothetical protein
VLQQLDEANFCKRAKAARSSRAAHPELGGELPVNTHSGLLGGALLAEPPRRGGAPARGEGTAGGCDARSAWSPAAFRDSSIAVLRN